MTIHREGTNILILLFIVLAMLNVPVWLFMPPLVLPIILSSISLVVYLFVFNFFRCPKRHYSGKHANRVVSSVDGRVVAVERVRENEWLKGEALMVSVFMSPLNVHANWFPVDGTVDYVAHHNGRSTVGITMDNGRRIVVRQIAGAMARRIVTYANPGERADLSEHLGFIKFGSRVDIYLPVDARVLLKIGDITRGGITPIAIVEPD